MPERAVGSRGATQGSTRAGQEAEAAKGKVSKTLHFCLYGKELVTQGKQFRIGYLVPALGQLGQADSSQECESLIKEGVGCADSALVCT